MLNEDLESQNHSSDKYDVTHLLINKLLKAHGDANVENRSALILCICIYITTEIKFNANIDVDWFNRNAISLR